MTKTVRARYTLEFKQEAVRLVTPPRRSVFADCKGAAFASPVPVPSNSLVTPESVQQATAALRIEVERLRKESADMTALFKLVREAIELTETTEDDRRLLQGLLSKDEKEAKSATDRIISRRNFKAGRVGFAAGQTAPPGQTLSPEKLRETARVMKCSTSQAAEYLMAQRVPLPRTFGG